MYIPSSTYRLQLNGKFTLSDFKNCMDYFHQLGISTVYGSPLFVAVPGSEHGYNVSDPQRINPEIGNLSEFEEIAIALKEKQMGWIQDIVPNHMAFDSSNVWLMDIFEKGKHSDYYNFFDIDWNHPFPALKGKVLAPFLSSEPEEYIRRGELTISFSQRGFFINFHEQQYPLCWSSYYHVLVHATKASEADMKKTEYRNFVNLLEDLKLIADSFENDDLLVHEMLHHKETLYGWYEQGGLIKHLINECINKIHNNEGAFKQILDFQLFVLVPWKISNHRINYRRFFTVNELICLAMEQEKTFNSYHHLIKDLVQKQLVDGLRVDHIDGLYNPPEYLSRLRSLAGDETYIIVEKILDTKEPLEKQWPVQGTSGYEFLGLVNQLFTCQKNKEKLSEIYKSFIKEVPDYKMIVIENKYNFLTTKMEGELDNLIRLLQDYGFTENIIPQQLKEALAIAMSCFPVYRMYAFEYPLPAKTSALLETVFNEAWMLRPQLKNELNFLEEILKGNKKNTGNTEQKKHFLMRLQQFTGPLAAKGIEDTAFYIFNRLISHNEVGDTPRISGINADTFHSRMQKRLSQTPYSLNTTSTHDTKRGEDARMRINVLSEMPEEWSAIVFEWQRINRRHKKGSNGAEIPSANEEYFIYQALLGSYPMDSKMEEESLERFKKYILKAIREAKIHTEAGTPNVEYENNTMDFIHHILFDPEFMQSFLPFAEKIAHYGMILSLSQTLVTITAPGIPDIYQGSELWDLSYVDPDNRRPVDYSIRWKYLLEINSGKNGYIHELINNRKDGRIKLMITNRALQDRKSSPSLYTKGEYIPLQFSGTKSEQLAGFARRSENEWRLVIFPVESVTLTDEHTFPTGEKVWKNTVVILPAEAPDEWFSVLEGDSVKIHASEEKETFPPADDYPGKPASTQSFLAVKQILIYEIMGTMPVALLKSKTGI